MPLFVWIIVAIVVLGALYFFFLRDRGTPALPAEEARELKPAKAKPKPTQEKAAAKPARPAADKPKAPEPTPELAAEERDESAAAEQEQDASPRPPPSPISKHRKDVKGLRKGLAKVRDSGGLFGRLKALFAGKKDIDPALLDEMEEILITSDVGVKTTALLLDELRESLDRSELKDAGALWSTLSARATQLVEVGGGGAIRNHGQPTVVLMVGVNGTGKTTTIGKLATKLAAQDKKVLLVAADTFRAAAVAQLQAWGERVGCDVHAGDDGADPASVVFDAIKRANEQSYDVVLVDTAGRLHTKSNLMDELKKVVRTCGKALQGTPHETLLVVDGTTGQNALQQAKEFGEALELTGIVLTKLDGTAKGGVVLAIASEHELPVRYVGVGERPQDLRDFDAEEFIEAMLGQSDEAAEAA